MKKHIIVIIGYAFWLGANHIVWAEDCSKYEKQTDLTRCYADEYKAVDRELDRVYASYRSSLDDTHKESLENVQIAWIKYRDLSCHFQSSSAKGGSAYQMIINICLADKTRARIKEIMEMSVCEEGDISCSPRS
ncbi:MAG: lysozyme inhibitor LprI family protein [Zoogloeaceae bacterium]|nr:lysozyme inhibitor LprI family protein [Zoogloeaceae bacterium]